MRGEKRYITIRTPLRISFAGGGTDIPDYYKNYGDGVVLSAGLNKYVYVTVKDHFYSNSIKVHYAHVENDVTNVNEVHHPSVRESLRYLGITKGIEISSLADVHSNGTGLGSSSSFAVGLLNALHAYNGERITPKELAEEAIHIERNVLKEAGGKQDQYIAAFGGIRLMIFKKDDTTEVKDVKLNKDDLNGLSSHLLLMYTGKERGSTNIHTKQAAEVGEHVETYKKMADLAHKQYEAFQNGKWRETGRLLHENWLLKKTLASGISDAYIDRLYNTALENGAEGGKILGAGGGGFFLFFADPDKHEKIIESLPELTHEPFSIEHEGSKVIYSQGETFKV